MCNIIWREGRGRRPSYSGSDGARAGAEGQYILVAIVGAYVCWCFCVIICRARSACWRPSFEVLYKRIWHEGRLPEGEYMPVAITAAYACCASAVYYVELGAPARSLALRFSGPLPFFFFFFFFLKSASLTAR